MVEVAAKRKVSYQLYPSQQQGTLLLALLRSHQQLYNAALEERISAWQKQTLSISYADQCKSLTVIRQAMPEWAIPNCSSQQMTLRRLFFQRARQGKTPGFPRFKSLARFPGFGFKSHGDGWSFVPGKDWKHGRLRVGGVGHIKCRGQARQGGRICASDLLYRNGQWWLSLTVEPEVIVRERTHHAAIGIDWGCGAPADHRRSRRRLQSRGKSALAPAASRRNRSTATGCQPQETWLQPAQMRHSETGPSQVETGTAAPGAPSPAQRPAGQRKRTGRDGRTHDQEHDPQCERDRRGTRQECPAKGRAEPGDSGYGTRATDSTDSLQSDGNWWRVR
ncbi:hypothetical protein FCG41_18330 [Azotobacter chroococcum]|nr:helix-turn-helix domain-containing protein [Azotobacter chroococcum]TKD35133.1 hypothetical protein FCG41_18330 [Azotobacter chroococcum]